MTNPSFMKRIYSIFLISLILNFVWENLHSFLYSNYMGGKITEFILFRASVADAVIITLLCTPFLSFDFFKKNSWLIIAFGIIIAIIIERWGLGTGRWAYNAYMPLLPILGVGFTPILQLGLTGYAAYFLTKVDDRQYL